MTEKLNKEEKNLFMLQAVIASVLRAYNDDGTLKDNYNKYIILSDLKKSDINFLKSLI